METKQTISFDLFTDNKIVIIPQFVIIVFIFPSWLRFCFNMLGRRSEDDDVDLHENLSNQYSQINTTVCHQWVSGCSHLPVIWQEAACCCCWWWWWRGPQAINTTCCSLFVLFSSGVWPQLLWWRCVTVIIPLWISVRSCWEGRMWFRFLS